MTLTIYVMINETNISKDDRVPLKQTIVAHLGVIPIPDQHPATLLNMSSLVSTLPSVYSQDKSLSLMYTDGAKAVFAIQQ